MPQLPRTYLERPLARSAGAAGTPRLPSTPQVDSRALQQGYGSLGGIGDSLTKLAGVLSETDKRVKEAEQVATRATKLGEWLQVLGEVEDSIVHDPAVPPLLRDENLKFRMDERTATLLDDVTDEALKGRLQGEFMQALALRQSAIRTKGRQDFVDGARAGLDQVLAQLRDQELRVSDPLSLAALRQSRSAIVEQHVQVGILDAATGAKKLREAEQEAATQQLRLLMRADPSAAIAQLEEGPAATPGLDPLKIPELLDEAHTLRRQMQQDEIRADQLADKEQAEAQDALAGKLRQELYRDLGPRASVSQYQAFQQKLAVMREAEEIGEEHEAELLRVSNAFIEARLTAAEKPVASDPRVKARLIAGIYDPSQQGTTSKEDVTTAMLSLKFDPDEAPALYNAIDQQRDKSHFSNLWHYQEGYKQIERSITEIVGPLDKLLNAQNSAAYQRYQEATSLYITYLTLAQERAQSPEQKRQAVEEMALPLAQELINTYAIQFRALEFQQLPKMRHGIQEIWQQEGVAAATARLLDLKDRIPAEEYQALRRNLLRREQLGYSSGQAADQQGKLVQEQTPDKVREKAETWLKRLYNRWHGGS